MRKNIFEKLTLRILCASIDIILILLPMFLISLFILQLSFKLSELYAQFVFLIYNVLLVDWLKGQTLGKKIGRLYVCFDEGEKTPLIKKGMREVTKLLYFLPVVGLIFCVVSLILYICHGKFLHDFTGNSTVFVEKEMLKQGGEND